MSFLGNVVQARNNKPKQILVRILKHFAKTQKRQCRSEEDRKDEQEEVIRQQVSKPLTLRSQLEKRRSALGNQRRGGVAQGSDRPNLSNLDHITRQDYLALIIRRLVTSGYRTPLVLKPAFKVVRHMATRAFGDLLSLNGTTTIWTDVGHLLRSLFFKEAERVATDLDHIAASQELLRLC